MADLTIFSFSMKDSNSFLSVSEILLKDWALGENPVLLSDDLLNKYHEINFSSPAVIYLSLDTFNTKKERAYTSDDDSE